MDKKNKKHIKPLKRVLLSFGAAAALIALAAVCFVGYELSRIETIKASPAVTPGDETFETAGETGSSSARPDMKPYDVSWPPGIPAAADKDAVNILLVGQDRRPGQNRQRSDTIIIISCRANGTSLKIVSLMRDMYLQLPGYSDNRINAAYEFGGAKLLDETIEKNFGIKLDGTVEVDFAGFTKIIDSVGGVDISLNRAEAVFLSEKNGWKLAAGENRLSGAQTLAYARIREIGNADYERTERQRTVLQAGIGQVMKMDKAKQLVLLDEILPCISTDMTKDSLLRYAYTIYRIGVRDMKTCRIPADGTFTPASIRGMAVLVPDLAANREVLKNLLDE